RAVADRVGAARYDGQLAVGGVHRADHGAQQRRGLLFLVLPGVFAGLLRGLLRLPRRRVGRCLRLVGTGGKPVQDQEGAAEGDDEQPDEQLGPAAAPGGGTGSRVRHGQRRTSWVRRWEGHLASQKTGPGETGPVRVPGQPRPSTTCSITSKPHSSLPVAAGPPWPWPCP